MDVGYYSSARQRRIFSLEVVVVFGKLEPVQVEKTLACNTCELQVYLMNTGCSTDVEPLRLSCLPSTGNRYIYGSDQWTCEAVQSNLNIPAISLCCCSELGSKCTGTELFKLLEARDATFAIKLATSLSPHADDSTLDQKYILMKRAELVRAAAGQTGIQDSTLNAFQLIQAENFSESSSNLWREKCTDQGET